MRGVSQGQVRLRVRIPRLHLLLASVCGNSMMTLLYKIVLQVFPFEHFRRPSPEEDVHIIRNQALQYQGLSLLDGTIFISSISPPKKYSPQASNSPYASSGLE